ncbi:hypothetical protein [Enterococcus hirae]|uniref:Uncharacterized protein n=1 Tax=Enterococcus hirae (strain ATCC 9790 / DSM 20160 / JCM 8729 / LMG 6399 / NBRC 3181 / NCIMB 6459 / NCDO 1258 / NCTC 12367 / WDCM 00089 / R) TaxID=768486 RepID=I6RZF2_ENTHA|nr:hypothetical protein [Enterococcus hirae]AFM69735.1 hypothetical protein EHR_03825 [Enterococcus hirae ATCC 9790]OJG50675.1 hypothetical protein RV05_GL000827 [Enterococcus hirae]
MEKRNIAYSNKQSEIIGTELAFLLVIEKKKELASKLDLAC